MLRIMRPLLQARTEARRRFRNLRDQQRPADLAKKGPSSRSGTLLRAGTAATIAAETTNARPTTAEPAAWPCSARASLLPAAKPIFAANIAHRAEARMWRKTAFPWCPALRLLKTDYDNDEVPSSFSLQKNIIAPAQILQTLGVDIFTEARFDSWALRTLFLRLESNKRSANLNGSLDISIIPLFSMFNHDCDPAAAWEIRDGIGGAINVAALRDIQKGEEICVSCDRCVREREAAATGGAFDVAKIRQDTVDAQMASQRRLLAK
ncbi:MAG: hypothetical protein ASARMPRED_005408 [Alectoria sarmentosa]|nr:MAG: hypothetical protein ASARMPRED_005408 [Alectoria sarmentosa]